MKLLSQVLLFGFVQFAYSNRAATKLMLTSYDTPVERPTDYVADIPDSNPKAPYLKDNKVINDFQSYCLVSWYAILSPDSELEPRIFYGKSVKITDYPFFVGTEVCGASILSDRWLLTAAHCVDSPQLIGRRIVFVGGESRDNSQIFQYDTIKIHPKYTPASSGLITYDIALLRLQKPLTFSDKVKPIKLPQSGIATRNPKHTFVGRGRDETGKDSKYLMSMEVFKLSTNECIDANVGYRRVLMENTVFCGRRVDRKPGMCMGDSGSPLIQNDVVMGLASFLPISHKNCGATNIGFYTNVAAFVPWIKSITGLN